MREITMKVYSVVLFLLFFPAATQATSEAPIDLIRTATEHVLEKLDTDPEIKANPDRLFVLIEENIAPNIDFRQLSRLAVGKHWRVASIDQQQRFTGEFKQLLIRTYSTTLSEYSGQGITYRVLNKRDDEKRAVVRSTVEQPGGPSIDIDYSLYQAKSGWKIYDMKVEGISLVVNYRSNFNREIRANGMDGLIKHLAALNH
jgi:phospholipid transport system substrate-binding protein